MGAAYLDVGVPRVKGGGRPDPAGLPVPVVHPGQLQRVRAAHTEEPAADQRRPLTPVVGHGGRCYQAPWHLLRPSSWFNTRGARRARAYLFTTPAVVVLRLHVIRHANLHT